ncbi:TadE/TadG family type IV pilus assembly protein [Paenibacillus sp. YYML68]|uniref:TadE/TadG family type IV pilus assembly protein n=1 Tax=Paenibacillus sp. YYML68 TaxID=2909250 RepID=UPI002493ACB5|nr:TadE family protein [Paenibacillus sp. YYML68]
MIREEKGQSLVEFALLLPIMLLLLCGIVDLGRLLFAYSSLNLTAQETVRLGGLGRSDADMREYARSQVRVGDGSSLSVQITPSEASRRSGQNVTVTLSYSLPLITPIMTQIIPAPVLAAQSTIRVE